jgi:hypothetical protein
LTPNAPVKQYAKIDERDRTLAARQAPKILEILEKMKREIQDDFVKKVGRF